MKINALQTFQLLRFVTTLFIGILLAKIFSVATADIAVYEVLLFLGNFLSFFWISASQKTLLSLFPQQKNQQAHLLWNMTFLMTLFGLLAGGILYGFQDIIVHQFTQFEQLEYLGLMSLIVVLIGPTSLTEFIYLLQKKEKAIVQYGIFLFGGQLLAVLLPLIFDWGLQGIFQALLVWNILKFIWLIKVLLAAYKIEKQTNPQTLKPSFNWPFQKNLLWLLFPLCLHMLIGGGMEYVDGFIVTSHFSEEGMFAVFRYGAKELPLVTILTAALAATLIPLAVENQTAAIDKIKTEVQQLSNWLFPVTMVLMIISPYLFPLVYNEDFADSAKVFNVYLLVISSRLLLPQVLIYARQHNFVLVWSAIIEVVINIGLSLYLVNSYELEGIAFATVIAYLVNKLILIGYNYWTFEIPLSDYLNIRSFVFWNVGLLICFYFSTR